jgi:hypothetical protein
MSEIFEIFLPLDFCIELARFWQKKKKTNDLEPSVLLERESAKKALSLSLWSRCVTFPFFHFSVIIIAKIVRVLFYPRVHKKRLTVMFSATSQAQRIVSLRTTSGSSSSSSSSRRPSPSSLARCGSVGATKKTEDKKASVVIASSSSEDVGRTALLATIASSPIVLTAQDAFAKGGEFGVLEGRTAALVHPFFLGIMYATSLYAGYLGLQWRKVRTVGEEIQELKKAGAGPETANGEAAAANPNQSKIDELTKERKELVAGNYKEKHFNAGSLLLAFGTCLAIEGGMNTYIRVGKLFPGPHLYAGMGIVALWAAAAGLVPEMQRGNDKARSAHIALNAINVALFTWQIPTGLEIVGKVFQFTSWP